MTLLVFTTRLSAPKLAASRCNGPQGAPTPVLKLTHYRDFDLMNVDPSGPELRILNVKPPDAAAWLALLKNVATKEYANDFLGDQESLTS